MKKEVLSFLIALLFLFPVMACASGSYAAGDMTKTAIMTSMEQGNQVAFHVALRQVTDEQPDEKQTALNSLLSKVSIDGIAYQTDGCLSMRVTVSAGDVHVLDVKTVQGSDGSYRVMSDLTGDTVFLVPATPSYGEMDVMQIIASMGADIQSSEPLFFDLPAKERLRITSGEVMMLLAQAVLGWVSHSQIEADGEMYVFDSTYLEPTDTRNEVAERMIGKVGAGQFGSLLWNIASNLDWQAGEFQRALADVLAENGVTRLQVRNVIDAMFPQVEIDPAEDFVQPTLAIQDGDAPCQYNDISYFFKKFTKFADKVWEESLDVDLLLTVSYDDYNDFVGLDAVLPKFTANLPYEGTFTYSVKTDENWQKLTTSHGELQISDHERVIGDYRHFNGEDVGGHNGNTFDGDFSVVDQTKNVTTGFGVSGEWTYDTGKVDENVYGEKTVGNGNLVLHLGEDVPVLAVKHEGLLKTTGTDFSYEAVTDLQTQDITIQTLVEMKQEPAEQSISIPEGETVDAFSADEKTIDAVRKQVETNLFMVLARIMSDQSLSQDVQGLLGVGQ
ncbi:MAG: hypothetical protein IJ088_15925 [Clostridia bacterium]|nr:hypothetical protein [Clostridia bacterium]